MRINNNPNAFGVWRNYNSNVGGMTRSMEKLSSGLQIVRAGDDPARLAISEGLRSMIQRTESAGQNIQDKISFIQTAEGWLQNVQDMFGKMGGLAVNARNQLLTTQERGNLQTEFNQMQQQIAAIGSGGNQLAQYGAQAIFGIGQVVLQVGPDAAQIFTEPSIGSFAAYTGIGRAMTQQYGSTQSWASVYAQSVAASVAADVTYLYTGSYGSANGGSAVTAYDVTGSWTGAASLVTASTRISASHSTQATTSVAAATINVNVSTFTNAAAAMATVNNALQQVSTLRAMLGAEQNRLEYMAEGNNSNLENMVATESRIRDVDIAREVTEFTRRQILVQTGTAMLSQANALPQNVLALLQ